MFVTKCDEIVPLLSRLQFSRLSKFSSYVFALMFPVILQLSRTNNSSNRLVLLRMLVMFKPFCCNSSNSLLSD